MNNNRLAAPDGDANPSTTSNEPPPVVTHPRNDVSFSSEPSSEQSNNSRHAEPFLTYSNEDSDESNRGSRPVQEQPSPLHAQPFISGDGRVGNYVIGPQSEIQRRLSTDRPVDPIHLGKVTALASKQLNLSLMAAASIPPEEVRHMQGISRQDQCQNILNVWMQNGNPSRNVFDLKLLLTKATENFTEDKEKFQRLIREIEHNPP